MHDQGATAGRNGTPARRIRDLNLAEGRTEVESSGVMAGGVQCRIGQARAFADAARGREQPCDAERESACWVGFGTWRNHAADVEQDFAATALRQASPQ